uniref:HTH psq-type domain-containing protein n=1 Tax=Timema douglasi TaxID=61478 RepID=A0A7R8ZD82_TIMDO|nr:unnamed protein product [Timema douglasi]
MASSSPHYSLRWNNHQNHILNAFDTLLQNETLVDVTLVCEETSVRAHKVVLSACRGWEVQAIVDFMYKGEISVIQEQLTSLIKAAESLQVRGLAHTEHVVSETGGGGKDLPPRSTPQPPPFSPPPPLSSLEKMGLFTPHSRSFSSSVLHDPPMMSPFSPSPIPNFEPPLKLPQIQHLPHISFGDALDHCSSPQPRRKQARPRRRSGDLSGVQDLSKPPPQPPTPAVSPPPVPDTAENLSMKRPNNNNNNHHPPTSQSGNTHHQTLPPAPARTPVGSPHPLPDVRQHKHNLVSMQPPPSLKTESEESQLPDNCRSDMHTPERGRERLEYCNSAESLSLPPPPPMFPQEAAHYTTSTESAQSQISHMLRKSAGYLNPYLIHRDSSLDNSNFPHLSSMSALSLTPPHMFSLDSPLGFFPGMEACRNPLLNDLPESKNENHHIMGKRKMGRPKGQHSAPRGGPPRSWTNAELTEALQHVWNKKMTTSQASRIFGIPYNSLLMYVRGKYGKSLKLEQLKKDCLGGPGGPLDLLGLGPLGPPPPNINNNNATGKSNPEDLLGPPGSEHDLVAAMGPGFNPYSPASFYPDFAASFPVPVSMIHLLPQSEKNRELFPPVSMPMPLDISMSKDDDCKNSSGRRSREDNSSAEEEHEQPPAREEAMQLVEQNGQN